MTARNDTKPHPLIGRGVHWKDEDGAVQNQAEIIAVIPSNSAAGDLALLQYFEWLIGTASTQRLVPLSELASTDRWVIYPSVEYMNDHYERVDEHQNRHIYARRNNGTARETAAAFSVTPASNAEPVAG